MNKYKLLVMFCEKGTGKNLRTKDIFVETNLNLVLTKNFLMTEEKNWCKGLKKIYEKLDLKIGENEIVCNIAVFSAPEDVFQKIVIEEEPKMSSVPRDALIYHVTPCKFLFRTEETDYIYNTRDRSFTKLDCKYSLLESSPMMRYRDLYIPKDVKFVD